MGYLEYISTLDFAYNDGYDKKMTLLGTIVFFFAGGRGQHGTYYFPVILQVAFMMPLIYAAVKRWKWGLWLCFGVNLALEYLKNPVGLIYGAYRLMAFRYIFALALGCDLAGLADCRDLLVAADIAQFRLMTVRDQSLALL